MSFGLCMCVWCSVVCVECYCVRWVLCVWWLYACGVCVVSVCLFVSVWCVRVGGVWGCGCVWCVCVCVVCEVGLRVCL